MKPDTNMSDFRGLLTNLTPQRKPGGQEDGFNHETMERAFVELGSKYTTLSLPAFPVRRYVRYRTLPAVTGPMSVGQSRCTRWTFPRFNTKSSHNLSDSNIDVKLRSYLSHPATHLLG